MYDDINDKDWWRLVKRISLVIGVIVLVPALIVPLFITVFPSGKLGYSQSAFGISLR